MERTPIGPGPEALQTGERITGEIGRQQDSGADARGEPDSGPVNRGERRWGGVHRDVSDGTSQERSSN
jgi:hypothetical protein